MIAGLNGTEVYMVALLLNVFPGAMGAVYLVARYLVENHANQTAAAITRKGSDQ